MMKANLGAVVKLLRAYFKKFLMLSGCFLIPKANWSTNSSMLKIFAL